MPLTRGWQLRLTSLNKNKIVYLQNKHLRIMEGKRNGPKCQKIIPKYILKADK